MMKILVKLGEIYEAEKLIPISSAQVSGVSYQSLGKEGTEWIEFLGTSEVIVPTTLNTAGMDLELYKEMKIPSDFVENQFRIIKAFRKIGITTTCSCTPHLTGNVPVYGQHISWSESAAVGYANSVIGARTNREGGPSALAAAIIGKTPYSGLHLTENRKPNLLIEVPIHLEGESDFSALGYWIGQIGGNGVPYIRGVKKANLDELKAVTSGAAASGGIGLIHVDSITPEANIQKTDNIQTETFHETNLKDTYEYLTTYNGKVDLVTIGCPHASLEEIAKITKLVKGKKISKQTKLWIFTSINIKKISERMGYLKIINDAGGQIYSDSCMIVAPLQDMGMKAMVVNSSNAAHYGPSLSKMEIVFRDVEGCVDIALRGET